MISISDGADSGKINREGRMAGDIVTRYGVQITPTKCGLGSSVTRLALMLQYLYIMLVAYRPARFPGVT